MPDGSCRHRPITRALTLAAFLAAPAGAEGISQADIARLLALVDAQQRQLAEQQRQLDEVRTQLAVLTAAQESAAAAAPPAPPDGPGAAAAGTGTVSGPRLTEEGLVILSTDDGVKVTLSGQINQAMNVAADGIGTDLYFVDNDVSNSRFRIEGTAPLGQTTLGALLEVAVSPNNSYEVSQLTQSSDDFIAVRRADLSARNDAYGKLSLGRGSMASDDTAEYDLSLVAGPIMYSGIADPVGGLLLTDGEALTDVAIGDAFFNFDGSRKNRIRYDTPVFAGLQGSVAFGDDGAWDVAANLGGDYGDWSGVELGDVTLIAVASLGDPGETGVDLRYAGSVSALHGPTGLGVTLAAGGEDRDGADTPYNLYGKLFYDAGFFEIGPTGFGIDGTFAENVSGDGDAGRSIGFAVVQKIEPFGLEVYGQARWFGVDRDGAADFEDVFVGTVGSRFKF